MITSIKKLLLGFVTSLMLFGISTSSWGYTVSLDEFSSGWKATFDPSGPDPRPYPCIACPNILFSGAAFEAANPGWRTVGYDDSSWATYTGNWFPNDGSETPFYLRKKFTLGTPTAGNFSIIVDDDFMVWVNGVLVPSLDDHSWGCCTSGSADILPYLHAGENVIAIKADNSPGGGFNINFTGSITSTEPSSAVPEPASLALLGLGVIGITFTRRRKAQ